MIPMALKELIAAFVNLLDTVMLGEFGDDVIAAVGIANQWYFLFTVVVFGMCGGAGVFAAQYWGAKDYGKMKKVLGLNIMLVCIASLVFVLGATVFPQGIISVFRKDTAVVEAGARYLRLACFSYIFAGLTSAYDISLCCTEKANVSFIVRLIGLITNFVLNYVLIYGKLGFPRLGVEGAAIATIIARAVELILILTAVYSKKFIQAASARELFTVPKDLVGRYFKAALPVILNESGWALGTILYSWVYSQISKEAVVVITIVQNIERLLLVFFHGGGNATGIMIGKSVGAGDYDRAYETGKNLIVLNLIFSVIISLAFVMLRPLVLLPYKVTPDVRQTTINVLLLTAILMNLKSMTFLLIVGIFRNGGATHQAAFIDMGSLWLIGVPLVLISGLYFKLPIYQIYIIMMSDEIVKLAISVPYFISKKWIKNLVKA